MMDYRSILMMMLLHQDTRMMGSGGGGGWGLIRNHADARSRSLVVG